ncbi:DNA translocase FtsK [Aestuariivirga litoralis]|uniref:DNA translocase FtsK n=1 Tax=Aestuariivirga litoralis TaxID=2650924 RepID=UPI0018C61E97|nr:DNA translocase FtsK [Aestuariivirga litoralis]MBG1233756.1 DUF87 domain-containing protein [Aestuariivirga litoralis]
MAVHDSFETDESTIPAALRRFMRNRFLEGGAMALTGLIVIVALSLSSWSVSDPSFNHATGTKAENWFGTFGAVIADQLMQFLGLGVLAFIFIPLRWASALFKHESIENPKSALAYWLASTLSFACLLATMPAPATWPLASGLGGNIGEVITAAILSLLSIGIKGSIAEAIVFLVFAAATWWTVLKSFGLETAQIVAFFAFLKPAKKPPAKKGKKAAAAAVMPKEPSRFLLWLNKLVDRPAKPKRRKEPAISSDMDDEEQGDALGRFSPLSLKRPVAEQDEEFDAEDEPPFDMDDQPEADEEFEDEDEEAPQPSRAKAAPRASTKPVRNKFELPSLDLLSEPKKIGKLPELSKEQLEENARRLEGVLEDFGVRGQIIAVRPGPVVTLYELEPAPGIKSSRVISLADDIARSMSAIAARVAVVPGRNAIGIELPNSKREMVYIREMFQNEAFIKNQTGLTVVLGKNIGGEPVYADLARMPHVLIAGTTGSGKSVGINTLILSLLYRLSPDKCKLIMIDPKMLELSIYEGIPHLLAPVVTDPRKAVVALKWAVREMNERYAKMSKCNVRNIDGYNAKVAEMKAKGGGAMSRTIQTGFNAETGEPIFEEQQMDLSHMPFIVVIIDEMADLMLQAGKDIEGSVQSLAQKARAAGIHVVMATQRPSVDVITGTIKANFPTRISFQVTSKIDSRTILGEMGAEQLLGQGDMLYMAGGGRITRAHGPFVSDGEVEKITNHLRAQGVPEYVEAVTEEEDEGGGEESAAAYGEGGGSGDELYDQAVQVVLRDKKVSTSYVQRRLSVGYNKAASLIERMEKEGLISAPNGQGKREILVPGDSARP